MTKKKIWTEEEEIEREVNNLIDFKGKSCKNCAWALWESGMDFVTCGHHYENFLSSSYCAHWTDLKDPKLIQAMKASKERVRARLKAKGLIE